MTPLFSKGRTRYLAQKALQDGKTQLATQPQNDAGHILCAGCGEAITTAALSQHFFVCPSCGHHFPIGAYYRIHFLLDAGSFQQLSQPYHPKVSFPSYNAKRQAAQEATGLNDAIVTATGTIDGRKVVVAVLDSRFLMGSMGTVVGEVLTQAIEYATGKKCPLLIFSASGGARMQEGILSLMQMAKTSAAIAAFSKAGGLYISIFTHPTTGGVTASFASLGDITLSEPNALIGFAGPRVIQQTIGQTLPEGFQRAEYLMEHGFVDAIVPRGQMRQTLEQLLLLHSKGGRT
ncbi:acetyl-CoA carboxylase, carboxyltransferase subunit beta [Bengtsoniella intestinalis]|uniref:acetyl-CoA carboxylase, carboxyltransferase subunit beta n=1 Tax=Bengtsoniella intestinalis TaxID=3073143 RepID=UPI00391F366A